MVAFPHMPWELIVQSPDTKRTEYSLMPGKTTLGRMSGHDIVITDEAASRNHAVLELGTGDRLVIWDAGSTNGTFVNGREITGACALGHNDQIRIGLHLITVISKDMVAAVPAWGSIPERPADYEQLLIRSLDHYTILLLELSIQLSKIQNLVDAQHRVSAFIGRMLNADRCGLVLSEDSDALARDLGAPEILAHIRETKAPLLVPVVPSDSLIKPGITSLVISPVLIDQEVVAFIYALKDNQAARSLDELDRLLVVGVSHHAAMTIQRLKYEQALLQSANHDMLTGLPNRKLFLERLTRAIARTRRHPAYGFAVFFIDANNFKLINDSLGHQLGDEVLRQMGARLQLSFRELDTVARFGGDEFAVLVDDVHGIDQVLPLAQRLLESAAEPYVIREQEFVIGLSVGITLSNGSYELAEDALRDADIAMYKSKEAGGPGFRIYDRVMHAQLMNSLKLHTDLRNAYRLEEFMLQYQPIIAMESGQIRGFEALIRWRSRDRGLLKPDQFFSAIDTTGLLHSVECWVLKKAAEQIARWTRQFTRVPPLFMSVNLSGKALQNPGLVELVSETLTEFHLQPDQLWLEISEKHSIDDEATIVPRLKAIRALGTLLCLDDFGTGYSTLGYLSRLPINVLKIDRSLISELELNPESNKITNTVINLADNLGLRVVAEGVETAPQLDFLKRSRCHYAQGYYYSEPVNAERITELLESDRSFADLPSAG
jgi:diguanylate cyclase (GGDEF)-like protein